MRWVYFLFILFIVMAVSLSMISCTKINFVCNDIFDSTLTLSKKGKQIREYVFLPIGRKKKLGR